MNNWMYRGLVIQGTYLVLMTALYLGVTAMTQNGGFGFVAMVVVYFVLGSFERMTVDYGRELQRRLHHDAARSAFTTMPVDYADRDVMNLLNATAVMCSGTATEDELHEFREALALVQYQIQWAKHPSTLHKEMP